MTSKPALRQQMRERRRALDEHNQVAAADALCGRIAATRLFQSSRRIALYYPADGEIDPTALLERAWATGKRCFLPVLWPIHGNELRFAPVEPDTRLDTNRYGIPEPRVGPRRWKRAREIDLLIIPLVAADRDGNRLGMGGGYYDRSLAFLARHRLWRRPRLLGAAYEFQIVKRLPAEPWDIRLNAVATDQDLYIVPPAGHGA